MLEQRLAAGPTPMVGTAGGAVLVGLVAVWRPGGAGQLAVAVAMAALAGSAAYLLDDAAAGVTVSTPRPLWRRRAGRVLPGVLALGLLTAGLLALVRWRDPGFDLAPMVRQSVALGCAALGGAALAGRAGEDEPGALVASVVVLVGVGVAVVGPLVRIPGYSRTPLASPGDLLWSTVAAAGVLALVAGSRDPAAGLRSTGKFGGRHARRHGVSVAEPPIRSPGRARHRPPGPSR